jgi:hemerythrin
MEFFPWRDEYSVRVKEIDLQHQQIVKILNEFYNAFIMKEHEKITWEIINRLTDYAANHFKTEEKYFHQYNFEYKTQHIQEHQAFVQKVVDFRNEYETNKSALTFKIINFLKEWLTHHIMVEDKKYTTCFNNNGLH